MVYLVHINYTTFKFYDVANAMSFAELARRYITGDNNEVSVEFIIEEPAAANEVSVEFIIEEPAAAEEE